MKFRTLSVLVLLVFAMVIPIALAKRPPDITITGDCYNIFWEETHHPKRPNKY